MQTPKQSTIDTQTNHVDHSKRNQRVLMLAALFIIAGIIFLIYWLCYARFHEDTDDAYVGGNMVQLMPQIPGIVVAINGDDTTLVRQGQVIVRLDPTDAQLAFKQAQADLANTVRQVQTLYQNADQLKAAVNLKKIALAQTQADYKRRLVLVSSHAISTEEFQHYKDAMITAEDDLRSAQHQANSAAILIENTQAATYPTVEQAISKLRTAYLNLQRTTILAPVTGYIAQRSVQLGQQVEPGSPLLSIIPLNQLWVNANFREVQLQHIQQGQPVKMTADIYGTSVTYHGTVAGLGAGTGSAFALLPPQNATGNWIKIVQRLPVRVTLDPKEIAEHPLRIGLSMLVNVDIHDIHARNVAELVPYAPTYSTPVFAEQQDKKIDQLINKIIQDNTVQVNKKAA